MASREAIVNPGVFRAYDVKGGGLVNPVTLQRMLPECARRLECAAVLVEAARIGEQLDHPAVALIQLWIGGADGGLGDEPADDLVMGGESHGAHRIRWLAGKSCRALSPGPRLVDHRGETSVSCVLLGPWGGVTGPSWPGGSER